MAIVAAPIVDDIESRDDQNVSDCVWDVSVGGCMYVLCVCMCMYACICMYVCMYVYVCVYVCLCVYVCMYVCERVLMLMLM